MTGFEAEGDVLRWYCGWIPGFVRERAREESEDPVHASTRRIGVDGYSMTEIICMKGIY